MKQWKQGSNNLSVSVSSNHQTYMQGVSTESTEFYPVWEMAHKTNQAAKMQCWGPIVWFHLPTEAPSRNNEKSLLPSNLPLSAYVLFQSNSFLVQLMFNSLPKLFLIGSSFQHHDLLGELLINW